MSFKLYIVQTSRSLFPPHVYSHGNLKKYIHSLFRQLKKVILLVNSDTAATLKDLRKENEALRKQTESLSVQVLTHQLLSKVQSTQASI